MRVIIIGAGVGGPTLAAALGKAGLDAEVYEAHDGPGIGIGAFLGLAPNGLSVLRTLGLLDAVRGTPGAHVSHRTEFLDGAGRRLGLLDDGSAALAPELHSLGVRRGELQAALAAGVRVEYGKRLVGYTAHAAGVVAEFADGSTAEGDVLIGADGLHSPVRRIMDPAAPAPRYSGLLGLGGWTSGLPVRPTPATTGRMVFGRRGFFLYGTAPDGDVYWGVNFPHPELSRAEIAARGPVYWRQHLIERFAGQLPDATTILAGSESRWFQPFGLYDLGNLPRWTSGRVGLIGDAAHAVPNSSGQGAAMAIEDAITLARCLRDLPEPEPALRRFEQLRRPRVERIIAEGQRRGGLKTLTNPVAVALRDLALRVVLRRLSRTSGHSWIFDHRIDFAEPVGGRG
ncbi:NAD(P)/FAD-dependent oxidoreductase [Crossiella sp. CA-258035]|uniref:FAD-dependent oxidoreductase n=1 Tax=Crossiella sp. CA-258035 TaxID=2981138 RepID=UPI0024BD529F|nr:NAD(P)/FAD-dependent oxidoreductase [Crossiella sp. CA-258035]WHT19442.1 NAD(P)/FAD-dependent oxidoreductase [Crossiella sp. CA-258035]